MDRHSRARRGRAEREQGLERGASALRYPCIVVAGTGQDAPERGSEPERITVQWPGRLYRSPGNQPPGQPTPERGPAREQRTDKWPATKSWR